MTREVQPAPEIWDFNFHAVAEFPATYEGMVQLAIASACEINIGKEDSNAIDKYVVPSVASPAAIALRIVDKMRATQDKTIYTSRITNSITQDTPQLELDLAERLVITQDFRKTTLVRTLCDATLAGWAHRHLGLLRPAVGTQHGYRTNKTDRVQLKTFSPKDISGAQNILLSPFVPWGAAFLMDPSGIPEVGMSDAEAIVTARKGDRIEKERATELITSLATYAGNRAVFAAVASQAIALQPKESMTWYEAMTILSTVGESHGKVLQTFEDIAKAAYSSPNEYDSVVRALQTRTSDAEKGATFPRIPWDNTLLSRRLLPKWRSVVLTDPVEANS